MSDKNKLEHSFTPVFDRLLRVGSICAIIKPEGEIVGREVCIRWDLYSTVIYCYLLRQSRYLKPLKLTYDNISANTNCSSATVKRKIKDMEKIGILTIDLGRKYGGGYKTAHYEEVKEIIDNPEYRLCNSEYFDRYMNKIKDRKERLTLIRDSSQIDKSWTTQQAVTFWRNKNYELLTGVYLKGDKTEKLLYVDNDARGKPVHKTEDGFNKDDELREWEVKQLIEDMADNV